MDQQFQIRHGVSAFQEIFNPKTSPIKKTSEEEPPATDAPDSCDILMQQLMSKVIHIS